MVKKCLYPLSFMKYLRDLFLISRAYEKWDIVFKNNLGSDDLGKLGETAFHSGNGFANASMPRNWNHQLRSCRYLWRIILPRRTLAKAYDESKIPRKDIQLISKCGIQYLCEARNNKIKHYNYSKKYIIWSAERSLKCLKTDYLDLFLLHRPSPLMSPDEIAEAITKLKDSGKIRQFGVSNFSPSQIALLETVIPVSGNQVEFSLMANQVMHDGTLDDCMINRRMAMAWSPLGGYFWNGK